MKVVPPRIGERTRYQTSSISRKTKPEMRGGSEWSAAVSAAEPGGVLAARRGGGAGRRHDSRRGRRRSEYAIKPTTRLNAAAIHSVRRLP